MSDLLTLILMSLTGGLGLVVGFMFAYAVMQRRSVT